MRWWRKLVSSFPWSSRRRERDLDREIAAHLVLEAEELEDGGLSAADARDAARRTLGSPVRIKEDARAAWTWLALERLAQDLRYAGRACRKSPGFTVVTLLILALGIGATTTLFSIVNSVLLRPLPFRDPDRLVLIDEKWLPRFTHFEATPRDFLGWQQQCRAFTGIAAYVGRSFNLATEDGPERISGARVTANLPAVLGVEPVLGRTFRPDEDTAENNTVILIGHDLWRRRFNADPHIAGRAVRLNDIAFTIVGVMPPEFRFPQDAEIWRPMGFTRAEREGGSHFIWGIGRLKPHVTHAQAQAEMDVVMHRLSQVWSANVIPLMDHYVGDVRRALVVLLGAAGFVLLIACVNVANLLLARASVRQKEISLRASLGASRGRIVQQLLTEALLLATLGGALGLLLASLAIQTIRQMPATTIARLDQTTIDYPVLLFTLALSVLTTAIVGVSPALRLSRVDLQDALRTGGRTTGADPRSRVRSTLVVAEVALALVLLVGAGLLIKSFRNLLDVRPGFNPEHVLTARISLPEATFREPHQQVQFTQQVIERLATQPDVRAVAASNGLPMASVSDSGLRFDDRPDGHPLVGTPANHYRVTPGYWQVMHVPLIRGRLFTDRDTSDSPPVVIVNETVARRFFPGEDPVGRHLNIGSPDDRREIVGVVGDVRQEGVRKSAPPQIYTPYSQRPNRNLQILVRGTGDPRLLAETIRRTVIAVDRTQPIFEVRPMAEIVARSMTRDRFSTYVLGLFALLALVLAAVGIYGVLAYVVAQRTPEIGVRLALGAQPPIILRQVVGQGLRLVLLGLTLGLVASLLLSQALNSLLYDVAPRDPLTFAIVPLVLLGVALLAAYVPARRASRVDPLIALRSE